MIGPFSIFRQYTALSATFNAAGQVASRTQSNDAYAFTGHQNVDRSYQTNGLNQYLSAGPATFTYDANGNLTGDGASTWVYDVENRLVAARGLYAATLRYDPLGRLHETVTNVDDAIPANDITVRRLYDGGALVAEYDQTGAMLRRYVHGPNTGADTPLVWYEGPAMDQASARMLNTDLQGSVTSVTDFNGNPVAINRYDEYGIPQSGNTGRFQYTGQAWLPEIGLYYYKARIYSPTLGRFMQTDPIGYADGVNWYNYVGGDPVNAVDPSGTEGLDIGDPGLLRPRDNSVHCHISDCPREGPWWQQSSGLGGDGDQIVVTGARRYSGWGGGNNSAGFSMHGFDAGQLGTIRSVGDEILTEILVVAPRRTQNSRRRGRATQAGAADWCGSAEFNVPDGNWGEACRRHDDCYGSAGANKERCDAILARDIYTECTASANWLAYPACALTGFAYGGGLILFGLPRICLSGNCGTSYVGISRRVFDRAQRGY